MGSQGSSSTSTPLTGAQRAEAYQSGLSNMFGVSAADFKKQNPTAMPGEYTPTANAGAARVLNNGDYNKLQGDVLAGNTAGLDYAKNKDLKEADNDAAKRGVWSSGLVLQSKKDIDSAYAPAYAKAGGDATSQRYALETADLAAQNNRDATNAAFTADQKNKQYESKWRPADYLAGVWNGTGGTVSSGTSGGWSI